MNAEIKKIIWAAVCAFVLAAGSLLTLPQMNAAAGEADPNPSRTEQTPPTGGRVTMIDLGADKCIPCKMMAPILAELKKEYEGRADIIFIDVWKDPSQAKKYRIKAIPTQIFFDAQGREVGRHIGFMDKQQIIEKFTALGVP